MVSPLENHISFLNFVESACSFGPESLGDLCSSFGFSRPDLEVVRFLVFSPSFPASFQQYLGEGFVGETIPNDIQVIRHLQCLRSILTLFSDAHLDYLRCALRDYSDVQQPSLLHQLCLFFGTNDFAHLAPLCGGGIGPAELHERFGIELTICCLLSELLVRSNPENFLFLQRSLPFFSDGEKAILVPLLSCDHMWPRFRNIFFASPPFFISQNLLEGKRAVRRPSLTPPSPSSSPSPSPPSSGPKQGSHGFSISLLEFPNTRKSVVSKKGLPAPRPSLMLKGDDTGYRSQLFIVPVLADYDSGEVIPGKLKNDKPLPVINRQRVTFKNLQIVQTTIQLGNIRACLRFELRQYPNGVNQKENFNIFHWVSSDPLHIVSHSTLTKVAPPPSAAAPTPTSFPAGLTELRLESSTPMCMDHAAPFSSRAVSPMITDVIPEVADWRGGTRIAILGENFVDNPARVRVRFGKTQVVPEVVGPMTMVCYAPRHPLGQVPLSVSFDGENWSLDRPFYFTENLPVLEEVRPCEGTVPGDCPALDLESIDQYFAF